MPSLFFNKIADLIPSTLLKKRPETLLKKRLWHGLNFAKFLGTLFLQNTSGRLLLKRLKARKEMKRTNYCFFKKHLFRICVYHIPILLGYYWWV